MSGYCNRGFECASTVFAIHFRASTGFYCIDEVEHFQVKGVVIFETMLFVDNVLETLFVVGFALVVYREQLVLQVCRKVGVFLKNA